jgi:NACalpha-BTF3-like transcription factor
MKSNTRAVQIAKVCGRSGATTAEAIRALDDHGWDVTAAIDFIRRKMPIKAKEVPDAR